MSDRPKKQGVCGRQHNWVRSGDGYVCTKCTGGKARACATCGDRLHSAHPLSRCFNCVDEDRGIKLLRAAGEEP